MELRKQIDLVRQTKQLHRKWYLETYRDVAMLGMDPAEHYLKYGVLMGRNPGKNFDTRFYLETYLNAAKSGLNPLVHYALYGMEEGRTIRPQSCSPMKSAEKRIGVIRGKLLSLGFTDRPLAELNDILGSDANPVARALASHELAMWHLRAMTPEGWRTALEYISRARPLAPNTEFHSRLTVAEMICHHFLGQTGAGRAAFDRAEQEGWTTPDTLLARASLDPAAEGRIGWINRALTVCDIAPLALLPDDGRPPYDRLTCIEALPKVTGGPKVTVLIAAYDAADMLPTALRSLQEQTWTNLEIIVIDDCSPTPDTACVAEEFAAGDPRISLIRMQENGGAYVARNAGLDAATGTYVTIHDADDWSHPKKIETQVRFMEDHSEVMGCTSEQARCQEDMGFGKVRSGGNVIIFNTSSFLWRRVPVREALGYWDTVRFGADTEFIRRMQKVFGKASFRKLPTGPLSFQREAMSSVTSDPIRGIALGGYFGVRKEYHDAQLHHHATATSLRYTNNSAYRPFPVPEMMRTTGTGPRRHVDVVVAGDFRTLDEPTRAALETIAATIRDDRTVGIVQHFDYDLECAPTATMCPEMRRLIDGEQVRVLVYGEKITCSEIHGADVSNVAVRQRYAACIERKTRRTTTGGNA